MRAKVARCIVDHRRRLIRQAFDRAVNGERHLVADLLEGLTESRRARSQMHEVNDLMRGIAAELLGKLIELV